MRKKLLIKPALQLKHLALTLGVVSVSFVACYALFEKQVTMVVADGALDVARWDVLRVHLRIGFLCTLILLLIGIGLEHYFFFHSIAGPIYALEKGLRRLAQGDFANTIHIRETDELREVIQAFEDMKKQILNRERSKKAA